MSGWRAAVLEVLASVGVIVADVGWGAAPLPSVDMHGRIALVAADEDLDAIASERRAVHDVELLVYLDMPAGQLEADSRAIELAAGIARALMLRHDLPLAPLDRDGPHQPFTVDIGVQLVGHLDAGVLHAEERLGERLRSLAHQLAIAQPADALVEVSPVEADVELNPAADTFAAELALQILVDLDAGSWGGVRNWLLQALQSDGWRVDDAGWGAAPPPGQTYGDEVAGLIVRGAAGARFMQPDDDDDGMILSLRALLTTADPEDGT